MEKQATSAGHCNDKATAGWLRRPGGLFADVPPAEWGAWHWQVSHRFRDAGAVAELAGLGVERQSAAARVAGVYPFSVTPYYLDLADPGDPSDPILRQVVPQGPELPDGAVEPADLDPFREAALQAAPGLVHRYPDRVLLVVTNFCSTLCRHCMRKRAWQGGARRLGLGQIRSAVAYIEAHREVRDVLVSGGDPLELSARFLDHLLGRLRGIEHLDVVRLGTRIPVTVPMRVEGRLLETLARHAPVWINTQFNHPRELSCLARAACRRLREAGAVLGNQSVLMRGVNDSRSVLLELSRRLMRAGVRPYYLHHCDPIGGLDHLRVPLEEGRSLVRSLYGGLSGLAIPRFVVDLPGAGGKVPPDLRFERGRVGDGTVFESPLSGRLTLVAGDEVGSARGTGGSDAEAPFLTGDGRADI